VDNFQKRESAEIRVACADLPDTVLAHEDSGVGIVKYSASQKGQLRNNIAGNVRVPFSWN